MPDNPHDCGHHHGAGSSNVTMRVMIAAVALTFAFVIGEAIAGWLGGSLALVSDAGHNLADAAALGLSAYALWIARKPSNESMTFGYHRVGILAALVNAVSLVIISLLIVWEAINRLEHPHAPSGVLMMCVAAAAIVVNLLITFWLHAGSHDDLNVRSAYMHMLGDAISAVGVVIAGGIVLLTKNSLADPIVSFVIAALILWSSWGILKESLNVLLEGTPAGLDMKAVEGAIAQCPGVRGVHDLHVWTVGPGVIACSCHILVDEQTIREGQQVLHAVAHRLEDFHINHTTVQIEVEGHASNDMYCTINPRQAHVHSH